MYLAETTINQGGLYRCCLDTIRTLNPNINWENGTIIDCKHEAKGNKNIILLYGTWQWNKDQV
jgi:hypothetical protein